MAYGIAGRDPPSQTWPRVRTAGEDTPPDDPVVIA
jgi:hypothetical protein